MYILFYFGLCVFIASSVGKNIEPKSEIRFGWANVF